MNSTFSTTVDGEQFIQDRLTAWLGQRAERHVCARGWRWSVTVFGKPITRSGEDSLATLVALCHEVALDLMFVAQAQLLAVGQQMSVPGYTPDAVLSTKDNLARLARPSPPDAA